MLCPKNAKGRPSNSPSTASYSASTRGATSVKTSSFLRP